MHRIAVITESTNSYARRLCQGISHKAEMSYDWELSLLDPTEIRESELNKYDGFIARINSTSLANMLKASRRPVVDVFCSIHTPGFGLTHSDAAIAGMLAADHFLKRHFRNFAYYCAGLGYLNSRLSPFVQHLKRAGFGVSVYKGGKGEAESLLAATYTGRMPTARHNPRLAKWLARLPKPVGVFCAQDLLARQLLNLCHDEGMSVPNQVAVLGCDNDTLLSSFGSPALSSLDLNDERIGMRAAEALARMLQGNCRHPPAFLVHPRGVIARASTESYPVGLPWLADILNHIAANLSGDLSTGNLSRLFGLSHTTIEKGFRKHLGTTVRKTVEDARIDEAKRLLAQTGDKIESIARRCGYPSAQHFSGLFHRLTGHSPIAYRSSFATNA